METGFGCMEMVSAIAIVLDHRSTDLTENKICKC